MIPTRTLTQVPSSLPRGLDLLSWSDRRRIQSSEGRQFLTKKLIELMGPLHVSHPLYVPRPRSLLPMPNLAGRQPMIQCSAGGLWSSIKLFIAWSAR